MEIKIGLFIIAVGYCMIYFFDSFFKSCAHYPYIKFLEGTGLKVKFFNIQWITTAFNRPLLRIGRFRSNSKFLNIWFSIGLIFSLILLPISIVLLLYSFIQNFISSSRDNLVLSPIIPGINLPASEIFYYSTTLVICSIFHELGHALAAVKEDVQILSIGFNIIYILPVAYVNLNSENLRNIEPWKRLKILLAGVWHNLVLSFICYLLYISLPSALSTMYDVGKGVTVFESTPMSPLMGVKGLEIGNRIIKINDCEVKNEESWMSCLQNIKMKNGICFDPDIVRDLDESITLQHLSNGYIQCCDESKKSNVCFEFIDNNNGILELPSHVCLPARKMLDKTQNYCSKEINCPNNLHCFVPLLNDTKLFKIEVTKKPIVIYIGLIDDFLRTLKVSSYVPKYFFSTPIFAEVIKKMLEYLIIISLGLGLINIIPCFFMDGQHIVSTLIYILLSKKLQSEKVILVSSMICLIFTTILIMHCILSVLPIFF